MTLSISQTNNQVQGVSGVSYDANGNQTGTPSGSTVQYDVENRVSGVGGVTYCGFRGMKIIIPS